MHWAKTRQAARYNLAASGVAAVSREELGLTLDDVELTGPSYYGWPPLMEALAAHVGVDVRRLCHAEGTSLANYLVFATCLQPGDEVLIEAPAYELLADTARYVGGQVRRFPRRRERGFEPDPAEVRAQVTPRTRLIVLTQLHNPSSAAIAQPVLRELAALADDAGARLLVDEVYRPAAFDPPLPSAHRLGDHVLVTSSLTKVYGLGGLRCGWVVGEPGLIERMWRLNDLLGVIPAHPAERLSLAALRRLPWLTERARLLLDQNRRVWNAFLASRPDLDDQPLVAGTTAFPRWRAGSVAELCQCLRTRFETTVVPGELFGLADAFRVGLGAAPEVFSEGVRRLGEALDFVAASRGGQGGTGPRETESRQGENGAD